MRQAGGGPAAMLAGLCDELARQGHQVGIVQSRSSPVADEVPFDRQRIQCDSIGTKDLAVPLQDIMKSQGIEVVHGHGLWLPINRATYRAAKSLQIPLVWTTHGMLRPWALRHKRLKKTVGWHLFQRAQLRYADVIHATCREEADELSQLLPKSRIEVVPIGVDLPQQIEPLTHLSGKRIMLFMGRLHHVKGLMNLVEAINWLRPEGWRCVLAGPDEGGYQAVLEARIAALGLEQWFSFTGAVSGPAKAKLFRQASLFVLPSFTENFGIVVPEALSYGCPVLTTVGAPWSVLSTVGCGWQVDLGVQPLADKLQEVFHLPSHHLAEMGARGVALVGNEFTKQAVGERFTSIYQTIL